MIVAWIGLGVLVMLAILVVLALLVFDRHRRP